MTGTVPEVQTEVWAVPASYAQERIWLTSQLATGIPLFHILDWIRLPIPVDADTAEAALRRIVARHESLRTAFRVDDGALRQLVHAEIPWRIERSDLTHLGRDEQVPAMREILHGLLEASPPLDRAPLWRARLVKRGDDEWWVLFAAHHTIVDAAAQLNLHAELTEQCAAAAEGREPNLPDLPIQYADYAVWQRERLRGPRYEQLLGYWRDTLSGLPAVHGVPTDHPRPAERTFAGAEVLFECPEDVRKGVAAVARDGSASPFMVYLAAWAALLHRLSTQDDLAIGLPVSGRDRPELQPLIGMFVNVVVLRVDASGDPTFASLLERVRQTVLGAYDHQEMPYQRLVEALVEHRDPRVPPLYQLGYNQLTVGTGGSYGGVEDDLSLEVSDAGGRLEYNTALFEESTARGVVDAYLVLLAAAVADPGTPLSGLPVWGVGAGGIAYQQEEAGEGRPFVAPRTAAEELVAEVWTEVLGVERVGALDEFFDLGGHSLLALRVIARLSAAADVDLPIQAFFLDTTVAGVARSLEERLAAEIDQLSDEEAERMLAEQASDQAEQGRVS